MELILIDGQGHNSPITPANAVGQACDGYRDGVAESALNTAQLTAEVLGRLVQHLWDKGVLDLADLCGITGLNLKVGE